MTSRLIPFGPHNLNISQVFFETALSRAFVNLKPITPGHVLVTPKRVVDRVRLLTSDELSDLFNSVQIVSKVIEKHYKADALNIAIQDGKAAGQSVPHVHVHILPRMEKDFENNDDVYVALDNQRLDREIDFTGPRALRTMAEMAEEARELRQLFDENYRPKDDGAESSPGGGV